MYLVCSSARVGACSQSPNNTFLNVHSQCTARATCHARCRGTAGVPRRTRPRAGPRVRSPPRSYGSYAMHGYCARRRRSALLFTDYTSYQMYRRADFSDPTSDFRDPSSVRSGLVEVVTTDKTALFFQALKLYRRRPRTPRNTRYSTAHVTRSIYTWAA